jgi:polar amino acid transport system substrate-binding protein
MKILNRSTIQTITHLNTLCFFSLFCVLSFVSQSVFACSKTLRWNDDPPFTYSDERNPEKVQGISVDTVREILQSLNCELKLVKMPWARALESLKNGQIDIISGAFKTPERQEFAHFSSIDEHSPNILFLRKGEEPKWALNSLADIAASTFKLGTQINVSYSREFDLLKEQEAFSKRLFTVSDRESLWKMLELKRVDGVIADKITGLIELKALGFKDKIVPSSLVISNDPSYFAFSKQTTSEEFVQQFDKMFSELISNGTINKIENHYINQ